MCFHLSNEFYRIKSAAKWHENMMPIRAYFMHNQLRDEQIAIGTRKKQNLDGDKNNPKISGTSATNFHLALA